MKNHFLIIISIFLIFAAVLGTVQFERSSFTVNDHLFLDDSGQRIVSSEAYPSMSVKLNSSLKPINGYSYGNFGETTTFYAWVTNGSGVYTYYWSVNNTPVNNITTSSNTSSLTWNFTNPSEFGGGVFDYVNVTVTDSANQSSSASYYGTFWYEPEIFVSVSGNDAVYTPGTMNITVTDWLDVSPLNLTIFVNGKPVYETLTPGWGGGFPITIKYNFTKTGVYNITAVAFDDSGQRIASHVSISIDSHIAYDEHLLFEYLIRNTSTDSVIFLGILTLLVADIVVVVRNKGHK